MRTLGFLLMVPVSGFNSSLRTFKKVDFPDPFSPTRVILESISNAKFILLNKIFDGVYPKLMSMACKIGGLTISGDSKWKEKVGSSTTAGIIVIFSRSLILDCAIFAVAALYLKRSI